MYFSTYATARPTASVAFVLVVTDWTKNLIRYRPFKEKYGYFIDR